MFVCWRVAKRERERETRRDGVCFALAAQQATAAISALAQQGARGCVGCCFVIGQPALPKQRYIVLIVCWCCAAYSHRSTIPLESTMHHSQTRLQLADQFFTKGHKSDTVGECDGGRVIHQVIGLTTGQCWQKEKKQRNTSIIVTRENGIGH